MSNRFGLSAWGYDVQETDAAVKKYIDKISKLETEICSLKQQIDNLNSHNKALREHLRKPLQVLDESTKSFNSNEKFEDMSDEKIIHYTCNEFRPLAEKPEMQLNNMIDDNDVHQEIKDIMQWVEQNKDSKIVSPTKNDAIQKHTLVTHSKISDFVQLANEIPGNESTITDDKHEKHQNDKSDEVNIAKPTSPKIEVEPITQINSVQDEENTSSTNIEKDIVEKDKESKRLEPVQSKDNINEDMEDIKCDETKEQPVTPVTLIDNDGNATSTNSEKSAEEKDKESERLEPLESKDDIKENSKLLKTDEAKEQLVMDTNIIDNEENIAPTLFRKSMEEKNKVNERLEESLQMEKDNLQSSNSNGLVKEHLAMELLKNQNSKEKPDLLINGKSKKDIIENEKPSKKNKRENLQRMLKKYENNDEVK